MNEPGRERLNILGITTTALGDTVLNIPAINTIGKAHHIDLVVHSRNVEIFHNNPHIRNVITYRNNPAFRKFVSLRLKDVHYHCVVILHANSDILKLLPLIKYDTAYCVQPWNVPDLRLYQIYYDHDEHHIEKRMRLAYAVGLEHASQPMLIDLTLQELEFARQWLGKRHITGKYICVCPGASLPYRRWPVERFGQFINRFANSHPNSQVVIIGSRAEANLFRAVKRHCAVAIPAIGLGLRQLAALLHGSELLVTNDTGPMHLAQAVGSKVLALFGPSDPVTIGPRGKRDRVIASSPTCNPCITKKCKEPVCMHKIQVDEVLAMTDEMLKESRREEREAQQADQPPVTP